MNLLELAIVLTAADHASSAIQGVGRALSGVEVAAQSMSAMGQRAMAAGAAMTHVGQQIRAGFVGALDAITEPADRVADALAKVETVITPLSGTTEDALARMRKASIDWSKVHTDTSEKFLDTTYMMISAGLDEVAAVEATRTAMLTATATMGDSTAAANLIATVYNNMGDKTADAATEIGRLGDVLTKTQQTFQFADLGQLNEGLKFGIPTALQYGMSIEELSAVIGQLNNAGLQGGMAGTAFAASMKGMQSASESLGFAIARTADGGLDFVGTLRNIEGKFGSLSDMSPELMAQFQKAFGDEGFRGLSLMIGKSDELAANLEKVKDSAGAAATAAAAMEGTRSANIEIMTNRIDALKLSVADRLQPAIDSLIPQVFAVVDAVGTWLEQNPEVIQVFADGIAEMGAMVGSLVPHVVNVLKVVGEWIKANPELVKWVLKIVGALGVVLGVVGPVVMAFGAIAAGIAALIASKVVIAIIVAIATQLAMLAAIVIGIVALWRLLKFVAVAAWKGVTSAVTEAWAALTSSASAAWDGIVAIITGAWDGIVSTATGLWARIVGVFTRVWDGLSTNLSAMWAEVVDGFRQNFFLGLFALIKNFSPAGLIVRAFIAVVTALPAAWARIVSAVEAGIVTVKATVTGWIAWLIASFTSLVTAIPVVWNQMVETVKATVTGWVAWLVASFSSLVAAVPLMWSQLVEGVKATVAGWIAWLIASFTSLVTALPLVWEQIKALLVTAIDGALAVLAYFSPVPLFQTQWDGLVAWFASLSLAESGKALLDTLTEGIRAAANAPVEAVKDVVAKVRNLLPFSPAKEGPLSDLDQIQLVETVANAVRPAPLVNAMTDAAQSAHDAVSAMPARTPVAPPVGADPILLPPRVSVPSFPSFASLPMAPVLPQEAPLARALPRDDERSRPALGADLGAMRPEVHLHFEGGQPSATDLPEFERWARDNVGRIVDMIAEEARRRSRTEFRQ